jgi:hypothetical protein
MGSKNMVKRRKAMAQAMQIQLFLSFPSLNETLSCLLQNENVLLSLK